MCYIEPSRQSGNLFPLGGKNLPTWRAHGPASTEQRSPVGYTTTAATRSTVDPGRLTKVELQDIHAQRPLRAGTLPAVHQPVPERPPEGGSRLVAVVNADAKPGDAAPSVPVRQRLRRLASQPLPMDVHPQLQQPDPRDAVARVLVQQVGPTHDVTVVAAHGERVTQRVELGHRQVALEHGPVVAARFAVRALVGGAEGGV